MKFTIADEKVENDEVELKFKLDEYGQPAIFGCKKGHSPERLLYFYNDHIHFVTCVSEGLGFKLDESGEIVRH